MHTLRIAQKPKSACVLPLFLKGRELLQEKKKDLPTLREFEVFRDYVYRANLEKYFRGKRK